VTAVNLTDALILISVVALLAFTAIHNVRKRKSGGCGCGCDGCTKKDDGCGE
jgi:hypothetical protein